MLAIDNMIRLDNKTNIESLERTRNELLKSADVNLLFSKHVDSLDFGLVPFLIQFVASWYNSSKTGRIVLDVKSETDIEDIYHLDFLFPCLVYCWDRPIEDLNGNDLKPILKRRNEIQYSLMQSQLGGRGQKILLACFDHLSTKRGLLNAFYIDGSFITNEMQFDFAVDKALKKVVSLNRELRITNFAPAHAAIVSIIYELMKNTDDWGRTDLFNKPLNPNTRGVYLKFHRRKRQSYLTAFSKHQGLKDYFSSENLVANTQNELYFLELSVYDTGIGFVQRFEGKAIDDPSEQIKIIKKCLLKNNTSAVGIDKEIKGQGLDRIMRILDNKGFFWLRTGNVSAFRNLRKNRYKENCKADEIALFDWFTDSSVEFSNLQPVQGSVVTLVYPISTVNE